MTRNPLPDSHLDVLDAATRLFASAHSPAACPPAGAPDTDGQI